MKFRSKGQYYRDLDDIIVLIFFWAVKKNMSCADLSRASGVCYSTVCNLNNRETNFPRFHTLYRLAGAVGCSMSCSRNRIRLSRAG